MLSHIQECFLYQLAQLSIGCRISLLRHLSLRIEFKFEPASCCDIRSDRPNLGATELNTDATPGQLFHTSIILNADATKDTTGKSRIVGATSFYPNKPVHHYFDPSDSQVAQYPALF
ncbi:hypothetical protein PGTUg99_024420 [Puccinia graminis f. sp. tritici]|uniref:Uncharacterized protein n=1 Tax=Puccinia graminis f. sp. tritici TaxID=56615 RepID=A0A5B0LVR7_PUCGR|nr:hypothetical protein PGTUg99_024420 [Puccinia graminis f. sp. tritici]